MGTLRRRQLCSVMIKPWHESARPGAVDPTESNRSDASTTAHDTESQPAPSVPEPLDPPVAEPLNISVENAAPAPDPNHIPRVDGISDLLEFECSRGCRLRGVVAAGVVVFPCGPYCTLLLILLVVFLVFVIAAAYGITTFWNNTVTSIQSSFSGLASFVGLSYFAASSAKKPEPSATITFGKATSSITPNPIVPSPSGIVKAIDDVDHWVSLLADWPEEGGS
ncbi:hypothetical protein NW754_009578 [Fusarium falciforme]|nr:hypothetical protein NW754_009578 [Fusarium falciforme]